MKNAFGFAEYFKKIEGDVMSVELPCEIVSWHRLHMFCCNLSRKIVAAGFQPDVLVAIARGGVVPARILCDYLGVNELACIRVIHYRAGAEKNKKAQLVGPLNIDISGKKVLLVDDLVDTGETLAVARTHLENHKPADIRTAVMQKKINAAGRPDFSARTIRKWRWVIYPWAIIEDIGAFLGRVENSPQCLNIAARKLANDYGIRISEVLLREILEFRGKE